MEKISSFARRFLVRPLVQPLVRLKINPNIITLTSLVFAIIAFLYYKNGVFWLGAIFLFLCGIFDTFDGELARQGNHTTKLGGFLDSTIDRINEFLVYLGLFLYYYTRTPYILFWIFLALFGSMMVSYTRARGEGLGISPRVGLFQRFMRFILLVLGSFLGPKIVVYFLVIIVIGTFETTLHRIIYIYNHTKKNCGSESKT